MAGVISRLVKSDVPPYSWYEAHKVIVKGGNQKYRRKEEDREEKGEEEGEWERMMEEVDRACENDEKWMRMIQASWDCGDCGKELKERMMMDCKECGEGIGEEELHQTLIGLDVVGLFPAMKSKNTGRIIRRRIIKSKIKT